ncbi:pilus assembly protein PilM [Paenibacillus aestuarii]|uniref:Pilus assembly protein PilM n=1 Tax=Paenibacillus aestuarii TaxID=516965 RepID=A0ABW0KKE3_9BACL|nr:pilus assembly protein PilM [Paenibacillus aestuarii]
MLLGNKRIGITIDSTGVRYVKLRKRKTWEIDVRGHLAIPEGILSEDQIINHESLTLQMKAWAKAEGLKGAHAILAIPVSQVIIRKMTIPSVKAHELKQLVEFEVETALHLPFEDPVYDFIKVSHDDENTQILLYAAPKKYILGYVKALEEAGIHVKAVEFSAVALARAIAEQQDELFEESMLVSLNEASLDVHMFQNGNPIFMRSIALYDRGDYEDGQLMADQIGEIVAEISRMLSFYQYSIQEGASRISYIIVTGTGEGRMQLCSELSQAMTEIRVTEAAFDGFAKKRTTRSNVNAFRVGIGLALQNRSNARVNLLPTVKTETKLKYIAIALVALVWVAGMGYTANNYLTNRALVQSNDTKLAQLAQSKTALEAKLTKSSDTQNDPVVFIQSMKAKQNDVVDVITNLKNPLPVDAQMSTVAFSGESQIALTVIFTSIDDSSKYLFELRKLNFGQNATLQAITETTSGATAAADPNVSGGVQVIMGPKLYTANYVIPLKKDAAIPANAAKDSTAAAKGGGTGNAQQK